MAPSHASALSNGGGEALTGGVHMAELLQIKQVCKVLGVMDRTVRRLIESGQMKAEKQGGKLFFDAKQVRRLREERRRNTEKPGQKGTMNLSLEDYGRIMS
jgi:excisionase family DNA binding protein